MIDTLCVVDTVASIPVEISSGFGLNTILKDAFNSNQFVQGGIVLAALTWLGYQLKTFPIFLWEQIKKLFIYEITISQSEDAKLYAYFNHWYSKHYSNKYRNVYAQFNDNHQGDIVKSIIINTDSMPEIPTGDDEVSRLTDKYSIRCVQESDINYIRYNGKLLTIKSERKYLDSAMNIANAAFSSYKISAFFGKTVIQDLLNELSDLRRKFEHEHHGVSYRTFTKFGHTNHHTIAVYKKFKDLFFESKNELIEYLDKFKQSSKKYTELGIKHKTGIKFFGSPGTGKSSIAVAVADYLDFEIALINILSFENDDSLKSAVQSIPPKTVILFEDVDDALGNINRTSNKLTANSNVTFSTVLQILDGILSPENVIFIFTTNEPDSLDKALYRDGRINKVIEIGYPRYIDIINYMMHFYSEIVDPKTIMEQYFEGKTLNDVAGIPMVSIEKLCINSDTISLALNNYKTNVTK